MSLDCLHMVFIKLRQEKFKNFWEAADEISRVKNEIRSRWIYRYMNIDVF